MNAPASSPPRPPRPRFSPAGASCATAHAVPTASASAAAVPITLIITCSPPARPIRPVSTDWTGGPPPGLKRTSVAAEHAVAPGAQLGGDPRLQRERRLAAGQQGQALVKVRPQAQPVAAHYARGLVPAPVLREALLGRDHGLAD